MNTNETPKRHSFSQWRHGGWYINSVRYPDGCVGCVSNNYVDKKWRIVGDPRFTAIGAPGDFTFPSREAAACAEYEIAQQQHQRMAPWLSGIEDVQDRYSAAGLIKKLDDNPKAVVNDLVAHLLKCHGGNGDVLRAVGEKYQQHLLTAAPVLHEYAFDFTLTAAGRVRATSREDAEKILRGLFDAADCTGGALPTGRPMAFEASINDSRVDLFEVDGVEVVAAG